MSIEFGSSRSFHRGGGHPQQGQARSVKFRLLNLRNLSIVAVFVFLGTHLIPDKTRRSEFRSKASLAGYEGAVETLAFDNSGEVLTALGIDGKIRLWDVGSAQEINSEQFNEGISNCFAHSLDGKMMAAGKLEEIAFWQPSSDYKLKDRWPTGPIHSIQFSPDGKLLLTTGREGLIQVWELAQGAVMASFETRHTGIIRSTFVADGICWATISKDRKARVWTSISGGPPAVHTLPGDGYFALEFSPNTGCLYAGNQGGFIQVWDLATSTAGRRIDVGGWVTTLAIPTDGRLLAYGQEDGTVTVLDPMTQRIRRSSPEHSMGVSTLAFSRDGRLLASGSNDSLIKIWDVSDDAIDASQPSVSDNSMRE